MGGFNLETKKLRKVDKFMQVKTLSNQINTSLWRSIAAIAVFTAITAVAARITINIGPVPITMQPLAIVLSGLVLGARGGALAQLTYVALIALGLPLDANMKGSLVFFGPTAGYLLGFIPAAFVTGWLTEQFALKSWWGHFLAATVGMMVIYLVGAPWLALYLNSWSKAWTLGIFPFILFDLGKAVVAAGVAESGKYWLNRPQ
jgi:biotin transport system substrate-specific component